MKKGDKLKLFVTSAFILLLLVVVAGIILLVLEDNSTIQLNESDMNFNLDCGSLGIKVNTDFPNTCFDLTTNTINVEIERGVDGVDLEKLIFLVHSQGITSSYEEAFIQNLESSHKYSIKIKEQQVDALEIVPILGNGKFEKSCFSTYLNYINLCQSKGVSGENVYNYYDGSSGAINPAIVEGDTATFFSDSSRKRILNFSIEQTSGVINELSRSIYLLMPQGTSLKNMIPTIAVSDGASISPLSASPQDFSSPFVYTVTSLDNTTQEYIVYVETREKDDSTAPIVNLFPLGDSFDTQKEIVFNVTDEHEVAECMLILDGIIVDRKSNISRIYADSFVLTNLRKGTHLVSLNCTDSYNNYAQSGSQGFKVLEPLAPVKGRCGTANKRYYVGISDFGVDTFCSSGEVNIVPFFPNRLGSVSWRCLGQNGGENATCNAMRDVVVAEVRGTKAGEWSDDIDAVKELADLNGNYFIINWGTPDCSYCKLAQENIFSQYGYKKWAKENGIGMFYLNDYLRNTEKYQRVYEEYAAPLFQKIDYIGFPMMILVSNTEYDSLSEFTYRSSGSIAPLYRNELLTRTIEINGVNRTIESWIEDKNNPYTEEEREMWNINQFIEAISKQVSSYFTDDYEECEGGYCVPEPESPELPDSEDIPEENGPIVLGEWTSDFHAAKQYSEEHDIPMIVVWGFEGCGFCTSLKTYIDTSTFKDWMAERELVMVYCKDLAYTTYPDAMNFTWDGYNQKLSGAPAMAIYDKRVNSKPFVFYGVYGGSPFGKSADQKAQVFIDYIEDYLNG